MASAIMHICIAKKLNEKLKRKESELFLGTIAPDISRYINQSRRITHFITYEKGISIEKFIAKYPNFHKNDFELGYFIHLCADKIWFSEFLPKLTDKKNEVKLLTGKSIVLSKKALINLFYADYSYFNIQLINYYKLNLKNFCNEPETPKTDIEEIPIDKLHILFAKMINILTSYQRKKNNVLDKKMIIDYIDNSVDKILEDLKRIIV